MPARGGWMLCLAACGRVHFDAVGTTPDATLPIDGFPTGTFGQPQLVTSLAHPDGDDDPSATADLLELYFNSLRPGGAGNGDIWVSRRAAAVDPWGPPVPVTELNTSAFDGTPAVSADGLTMLLNSDRPGTTGSFDVWIATRPDRQSAWSTPVQVPELSSVEFDGAAKLDATQLHVALHSARAGGAGGFDIWFATRPTIASPFGAPTNAGGLNTSQQETAPQLVAGGLSLLFGSDRAGGAGGDDIYIATRVDEGAAFTTIAPLLELNSTAADGDPWLSPDGHYLLFTSARSGNEEIYEARR